MTNFRITQSSSCVDLGVYEGATAEDAIAAMLSDAGSSGEEPDAGLTAVAVVLPGAGAPSSLPRVVASWRCDCTLLAAQFQDVPPRCPAHGAELLGPASWVETAEPLGLVDGKEIRRRKTAPRHLAPGARCHSPVTCLPQEHLAEGWLGPAGQPGLGVIPMCAACAAPVIEEYRTKLGEEWVFATGPAATPLPSYFWEGTLLHPLRHELARILGAAPSAAVNHGPVPGRKPDKAQRGAWSGRLGDEVVLLPGQRLCGGPATGGTWREDGLRAPAEGEQPTHKVIALGKQHDIITGRGFTYVELLALDRSEP